MKQISGKYVRSIFFHTLRDCYLCELQNTIFETITLSHFMVKKVFTRVGSGVAMCIIAKNSTSVSSLLKCSHAITAEFEFSFKLFIRLERACFWIHHYVAGYPSRDC